MFSVGDPSGNFQNRTIARENPMLVLEGETPHLIDEWQEAPGIWDAVRMETDKRGGCGHFLLTGSSTPATKGILHSGTGRITKLRMRSMSLFESGDSSGTDSIKSLFDGTFSDHITGNVSLKDIAYLSIRGGWPGIIGGEEKAAIQNAKDYITSFLEDELHRIDDFRKFRDIKK